MGHRNFGYSRRFKGDPSAAIDLWTSIFDVGRAKGLVDGLKDSFRGQNSWSWQSLGEFQGSIIEVPETVWSEVIQVMHFRGFKLTRSTEKVVGTELAGQLGEIGRSEFEFAVAIVNARLTPNRNALIGKRRIEAYMNSLMEGLGKLQPTSAPQRFELR